MNKLMINGFLSAALTAGLVLPAFAEGPSSIGGASSPQPAGLNPQSIPTAQTSMPQPGQSLQNMNPNASAGQIGADSRNTPGDANASQGADPNAANPNAGEHKHFSLFHHKKNNQNTPENNPNNPNTPNTPNSGLGY